MKTKSWMWKILALFVVFLPSIIYADVGPKPSIQIDFTGLEGETYYATLLSETDTMGPWQAWSGKAYDAYDSTAPDYAIWEAFAYYEDPDGYYFLENFEDCSETHNFSWTYYPPNTFKLLLYFPESGTFVSSKSYDRYAFDAYYTVKLDAEDLEIVKTSAETLAPIQLAAKKDYDYTWELISLVIRIIVTIAMEIAVAWLFGYREASALRCICILNIITQIILNVILNITAYTSGSMAFVLNYILLEFIVFALEAIAYRKKLPQLEPRFGKGRATGYAFAANAASFIIGLQLARIIPGIF